MNDTFDFSMYRLIQTEAGDLYAFYYTSLIKLIISKAKNVEKKVLPSTGESMTDPSVATIGN